MKQFFKSLFGASSKEVLGFSALIFMLLLVLLIPKATYYFSPHATKHMEEDQIILDSLIDVLNKTRIEDNKNRRKLHNPEPFNPNQATLAELKRLGFPEPIASRIVNYRSKGGRFKHPDDLYKIYNIDSNLVTYLLPYIVIPKKDINHESKSYKISDVDKPAVSSTDDTQVELPNFDINLADTAMLQTIKGIGSVLSKRIIYFRDKLGGFIDTNQIFEVYNLDSTTAAALVGKCFIESTYTPKLIQINEVDTKTLSAHPYISWQQGRLIIAYRNQHGDFKTKKELLKVYGIDEPDVDRIVSYISWSPSN